MILYIASVHSSAVGKSYSMEGKGKRYFNSNQKEVIDRLDERDLEGNVVAVDDIADELYANLPFGIDSVNQVFLADVDKDGNKIALLYLMEASIIMKELQEERHTISTDSFTILCFSSWFVLEAYWSKRAASC